MLCPSGRRTKATGGPKRIARVYGDDSSSSTTSTYPITCSLTPWHGNDTDSPKQLTTRPGPASATGSYTPTRAGVFATAAVRETGVAVFVPLQSTSIGTMTSALEWQLADGQASGLLVRG